MPRRKKYSEQPEEERRKIHALGLIIRNIKYDRVLCENTDIKKGVKLMCTYDQQYTVKYLYGDYFQGDTNRLRAHQAYITYSLLDYLVEQFDKLLLDNPSNEVKTAIDYIMRRVEVYYRSDKD
jgi:hypothetical protein